METDYFELIESELFELTNEEDIKFLQEFSKDGQSLIEKYQDNKYRINFVGEVITPNNMYFSMPKNMAFTDDNVSLIKRVLVKYAIIVDGKSLVVSKKGTYSSERAYFNKLKDCFLDFITYEFIYPLKKKLVHSNSPISGGKVSVIDTIRNRRRFGTGISYNTKDIENSDDWMLDDIYYWTLKELESKLKISGYEKKQIQDMKSYLDSEGYNFNELQDGRVKSNKDGKILLLWEAQNIIDSINKSQVGVIHYTIKNTLLEYYGNKQKAFAQPTLDVIFTKNFEKVWERILQDALMNEESKSFEQKEKSKFDKREIEEEFIPLSEIESKKIELRLDIVDTNINEVDPNLDKWIEKRGNRYYLCQRGRKLIPDIFVYVDKKRRFIGDAKYYRDPSDSNYDKEFYIYNDAQRNVYPMVIFAIPGSENTVQCLDTKNNSSCLGTIVPRRGYRRAPITGGIRELILITVCVKCVIDDALNNGQKVLNKSISLITKYTRKPEWQG